MYDCVLQQIKSNVEEEGVTSSYVEEEGVTSSNEEMEKGRKEVITRYGRKVKTPVRYTDWNK